MSRIHRVRAVMGHAAARLDQDLSLPRLADRSGWSRRHWHRLFAAATGETPKQYTTRLRLDRAAALLLATDHPVLSIALACGFQTHESFCRAFRRRFGRSPREHRGRGWAGVVSSAQAAAHVKALQQSDPCLRLFRCTTDERGFPTMSYAIVRKELSPQPVLLVRRRVQRSQIAATLGPIFGSVVECAHKRGAALTGQPFTRFVAWGPGLLTIEAGLPIATPVTGIGEVEADSLPGGPAATTTHKGPYDQLTQAYAALELWIQEHGWRAGAPPWEVYVTDPAEHPDPKDWRTEVFWPIAPS